MFRLRTATHHSPLTTHRLPLTTCYSPLTSHHSPLTTHRLLLTTHHSPLATGTAWGSRPTSGTSVTSGRPCAGPRPSTTYY
eukprot:scaffold15748_cov50-Phaeocystis_antarctica.AAC.2